MLFSINHCLHSAERQSETLSSGGCFRGKLSLNDKCNLKLMHDYPVANLASTRWDDDDCNIAMTWIIMGWLDKSWSTTYNECSKTLPCDETQPHTWPFKYHLKYICPNYKMYLSQLQDVFVQIPKCFPVMRHSLTPGHSNLIVSGWQQGEGQDGQGGADVTWRDWWCGFWNERFGYFCSKMLPCDETQSHSWPFKSFFQYQLYHQNLWSLLSMWLFSLSSWPRSLSDKDLYISISISNQ